MCLRTGFGSTESLCVECDIIVLVQVWFFSQFNVLLGTQICHLLNFHSVYINLLSCQPHFRQLSSAYIGWVQSFADTTEKEWEELYKDIKPWWSNLKGVKRGILISFAYLNTGGVSGIVCKLTFILRNSWLLKIQLVSSLFLHKYARLTGALQFLTNRKCLSQFPLNIFTVCFCSFWVVWFGTSLWYIQTLSQEAQWLFYIVPTQLKCMPVSVYTDVKGGWCNSS